MSLMLLKRSVEVLVGAALVTILLAVLPAVAEAKEGAKVATQEEKAQSAKRGAQTTPAAHAVVVVRPGDSLWSISEEHLGPNATVQRIDRHTERLWTLNRERIGPDPNLIFPDQELSLPAVGLPAGESSMAEPSSTEAVPPEARETNGPAQGTQGVTQGTRAARGETKQATETAAVSEANGRAEKAHDPAAERQVNLPKAPAAPAVPAAASALAETFSEYRATADERRPLGWGIIALTLLVGTMMVRTLPMRRAVGAHEVWGIPPGRLGRYAYPGPLELRGGALEPSANGPEARALASGNGAPRLGLVEVARSRRVRILRERARGPRRRPRNGLATGAHGHNIRRTLLRAAPGTRRRLPTNVRAKALRQKGGR